MNKKKIILIALAVFLAGGIVLYFLLSRRSDAYLTALPHEVKALVRIDVQDFIDDADLTPSEVAKLTRRLSADDVADLGFNFSKPVYAFASAQGSLGMVAAVDDAADLTAWCLSLHAAGRASEVTRQRGYSWAVLRNSWLLAFDKKRALVMGPALGSDQDRLRNEMAALLEQDKTASGLTSQHYADLQTSDADVAAILSPELLPEALRHSALQILGLSSFKDALVRLSVDTDDDEIQVTAQLFSQDADIQQRLRHINSLLRPVQGAVVPFSHLNTAAWLCVNVEGGQALEYLRRHPAIRTALIALNTAVDADLMLKAIDGDVALDLGKDVFLAIAFGWNSDITAMLTAQLGNTDFLQQSSYWLQSAQQTPAYDLQATSPHDFRFQMQDVTLNFGVHDKNLYLNTQTQLGTTSGTDHAANAFLTSHLDDLRGKRLYLTVDLEEFLGPFRDLLGSYFSVFSACQRVTLEMEEADEWEVDFQASSDINIAKHILLNL